MPNTTYAIVHADQYLIYPSVENSAKVFAKLAVSCTGKALREVRRVPRGNGRAAWLALKNRFASIREKNEWLHLVWKFCLCSARRMGI